MSDWPLIVVVGPTASGKTALSLKLAEQVPAEIVSCDSVAVYKHFEVGTAKPTREDRARVPHHLIDVAEPDEPFTAGDYARYARGVLHDIKQRGKTPIVVGGTGFYLRALIAGLFAGPARSDELRERLRQRATKHASGYLHLLLSRLDGEAAARIHPNDAPKLIRAIEVCLSSGQRMTSLHQRRDPLTGFSQITIGLDPDRQALYARINERCRRMFATGLIEETHVLLARYGAKLLDSPSSPLNALGYRQAVQHIRGELSMDAALAAAQQAHRNYAKRQLTWFRNIGAQNTQWLRGFGDDPAIEQAAIAIAAPALSR